MTQILRQSTQVKVVIGPVVAVGDGVTPVITLSLSAADEAEILKHDAGAVTDISGATFAAIAAADGYYNLTLTAALTDTVGLMTVLVNDDSLCLPAKATFQVVEEATYDALYATGANGFGATGQVAVATNSDKSGYSLAADQSAVTVGTVNILSGHTAQTGDSFARLGAPSGASVSADILSLLTRLTAARGGYLDNLNVGGLVGSQADIAAITVASRVRVVTPPQMERPDSATTNFRVWVYSYGDTGTAEDLDSNPTVTVENNAGTDRSANLGAVTKPGATTGVYFVDYTVSVGDAIEGLVFKVTAIENAVATVHPASSVVVDTTAVDFTSTDRAKLDTLHDTRLTAARAGFLDNLNGHTAQTGDSFARLGAPAGASMSADVAAVRTVVDETLADTGTDGVVLATDSVDADAVALGAIDAAALATSAINEITGAIRQAALTEGYAAQGAAPTVEQALMMILQRLTEVAISGTTQTVKKLDRTSTAFSLTLDDATSPTSSTRAP
jgi:hypothetical protein